MNANRNPLPKDLPDRIVTVLQEVRPSPTGRGSQLYADYHFDHPVFGDDKVYKLVINPSRQHNPRAGEEWEIIPIHCPNGCIIFCELLACWTVNPGDKHPIEIELEAYTKPHCHCSIEINGSEMVSGNLESLEGKGSMVHITVNSRTFQFPAGNFPIIRSGSGKAAVTRWYGAEAIIRFRS